MKQCATDEHFTDGDDEILESIVKTVTKAPGARPTPRERKRTRHADRKSCELKASVFWWGKLLVIRIYAKCCR